MKTLLMIVAMALSVSGIAVAEETTTDEFGNTYPAATITAPAATVTELQGQLSAANAELYELRLRLKTQENRNAELAAQVAALAKENALLRKTAHAAATKPAAAKVAPAHVPVNVVYADIIAGMPQDIRKSNVACEMYIQERITGNIVTVTGKVSQVGVGSIMLDVKDARLVKWASGDKVVVVLKQALTIEQIARIKINSTLTLSGLCRGALERLEQQ